jgi:hypothetical protein
VPAEPEPPVIGDEKRCRELAKAAIRLINEREKFRSGRIRQKLEGTDEVINAASGTIVWVELAVEAVVDWDTLSEVIAEITPCKDTVEARSQFSGVFTDTLLKTMRAKTLADNLRAKMQSQQKEE